MSVDNSGHIETSVHVLWRHYFTSLGDIRYTSYGDINYMFGVIRYTSYGDSFNS